MAVIARVLFAIVAFAAVAYAPGHKTTRRMTLLSGHEIVVLGDSVTGWPDYTNRFLPTRAAHESGIPF